MFENTKIILCILLLILKSENFQVNAKWWKSKDIPSKFRHLGETQVAKNLLQSVRKLPIFTSSKTHTLLKLNAMYQKWFQILENWPLILTLFHALYFQLFCKGLAKIWMYVSYFEWRESQYTLESRINISHKDIDLIISTQFLSADSH